MHGSAKLNQFRPAHPDDIGHITHLVTSLYVKLGSAYQIPMDTKSVVEAVIHTIRHGVCLVGDHACAGGFIDSFVWNRSVKVGNVLFWNYSRPSGVRILEALAVEFQNRGASHLGVASHYPDNLAARFYSRIGLQPCEQQHIVAIETIHRPFSKHQT